MSDFISAFWTLWTGKSPSPQESDLIEACLVACMDHGAEPPSAHTSRVVASCGKPLADCVAAGLLTLGPRHGNAGGAAAEWIKESVFSGLTPEQVADKVLEGKRRLPGLGHPVYEVDPRTTALFETAKKNLGDTKHFEFALAVSRALSEKKGKPLPLNVDGALGAIMVDMETPSELADAIFIVARSAGLIAHAREEAISSESYRRG